MSRENFEERVRQRKLEEADKFYEEENEKRTPEQKEQHEKYLDDMRKRYSLPPSATEAEIMERQEEIDKGLPSEF